MEWPRTWVPIQHPQEGWAFEAELSRELKPGHLLFGLPVTAIGCRYGQDDVLFEVRDGSGRIGVTSVTGRRMNCRESLTINLQPFSERAHRAVGGHLERTDGRPAGTRRFLE